MINADVRSSNVRMLSVSLVPRRPSLTDCIPFIVYVWTGVNDRRTRVDENIYMRL